jgi:hypothetical protein
MLHHRLGPAKDRWALLVLLALAILTWVPRARGPIDLRWDGSVYYVLGTSLAEGKGYRLLNEPGAIDGIQYPPLLPAIIAAHQVVLGTSDFVVVGRWLRLFFFLAFVAYIGAAYRLVRTVLSVESALLATTICLLSTYTWFMSDLCFADIPFGLSTALFFLCHARAGQRGYAVLAAVLAVASYLLRTAGIALLAAWVAESLVQRRFRRALLRTAVAAVAILPWQAYVASVESSPGYRSPAYAYQRAEYLFYNVTYARNVFSFVDPLNPERGRASWASLTRRVLHNVLRVPGSLGEGVSTNRGYWETFWGRYTGAWPLDGVRVVLGCFVIGGLLLHLAKGRSIILPLYAAFYLALMCLTPWPEQFVRYVVPVMPLLACWLVLALLAARRRSQRGRPGWKMSGSAVAVGIVSLIFVQETLTLYTAYAEEHPEVVHRSPRGQRAAYRLFFYKDSYRAFDEALDWLKPHARTDDVVAASDAPWVFLRTGLKAVMPPFEPDPARAQQLLDTVPVRYLVQQKGSALDLGRFTLPVLERFPGKWKPVYEAANGTCAVYERVDR